jgi:hypothetical protein
LKTISLIIYACLRLKIIHIQAGYYTISSILVSLYIVIKYIPGFSRIACDVLAYGLDKLARSLRNELPVRGEPFYVLEDITYPYADKKKVDVPNEALGDPKFFLPN